MIHNLVDALKICAPVIQNNMIEHFTKADPDYGRRVAEGLAQTKVDFAHLGSSDNRDGAEIAKQSGKQTDGY
uniref:catalase-related domain-containing protein n=1 Tax=Paenibacillus sp. FSL K6-0276 TaxID=2921450 RepID=UPI00403F349A